jgi:hypothetical protein
MLYLSDTGGKIRVHFNSTLTVYMLQESLRLRRGAFYSTPLQFGVKKKVVKMTNLCLNKIYSKDTHVSNLNLSETDRRIIVQCIDEGLDAPTSGLC